MRYESPNRWCGRWLRGGQVWKEALGTGWDIKWYSLVMTSWMIQELSLWLLWKCPTPSQLQKMLSWHSELGRNNIFLLMSQDFILCECELFFSHLGFICSTTKCRLRKNLVEKVIFKSSLFWVGWECGHEREKMTENQVKTTDGYIVKKEVSSSHHSLLTP